MIKLLTLHIERFRSLYAVTLHFRRFSVLVGPNGAGKSNTFQALSFLSDTFSFNVEHAVARGGGIEALFFRRARRSRAPLRFALTAELHPDELSRRERAGLLPNQRRFWSGAWQEELPGAASLLVKYSFAIAASSEAIAADFTVVHEELDISAVYKDGRITPVTSYTRAEDHTLVVKDFLAPQPEVARDVDAKAGDDDESRSLWQVFGPRLPRHYASRPFPPTRLWSEILGTWVYPLQELTRTVGAIRAYSISPQTARQEGSATPNAELQIDGGNLPAVINYLQTKAKTEWKTILSAMQAVLPGLSEIRVGYSTSRRLWLEFVEAGLGRPWTPLEISDGTLKTLAALVALHDSRSPIVLIEEPENSIHPWMIREFVSACRHSGKQILLTTHSPVVLEQLEADEVDVVWRRDGVTKIESLASLDPEAARLITQGTSDVARLLDTGWVREAVPGTDPE